MLFLDIWASFDKREILVNLLLINLQQEQGFFALIVAKKMSYLLLLDFQFSVLNVMMTVL